MHALNVYEQNNKITWKHIFKPVCYWQWLAMAALKTEANILYSDFSTGQPTYIYLYAEQDGNCY